jgi:osmotically inducible lipoprotein OsmB
MPDDAGNSFCSRQRASAPASANTTRQQRRAAVQLSIKEMMMNPIKKLLVGASVAAMALSLSACANMSGQDKDTAVGAGVGAVAGSVLTGGSGIGTVGGAAVGGVIGNQVGKPK